MTLEEAKRILNTPADFWDLEQQALVREAKRIVDTATRWIRKNATEKQKARSRNG